MYVFQSDHLFDSDINKEKQISIFKSRLAIQKLYFLLNYKSLVFLVKDNF